MAENTIDTELEVSTEEAERKLEETKTKLANFQKRIKRDVWGHSENGILAISASKQMLNTKTGLYTRIPIYCKGNRCPYKETCVLLDEGLAPEGEACPVEIALLDKKLTAYYDEFDLGGPESGETDRALVEEIILMEINMERCKALMSNEVSPVQMMVAGMSDDGEAILQPQVSKAVEAYERFSKKRAANYDLLLATRRNKAKDLKNNEEEEKKVQSLNDIIESMYTTDGAMDIEKRPDEPIDATFTDVSSDITIG